MSFRELMISTPPVTSAAHHAAVHSPLGRRAATRSAASDKVKLGVGFESAYFNPAQYSRSKIQTKIQRHSVKSYFNPAAPSTDSVGKRSPVPRNGGKGGGRASPCVLGINTAVGTPTGEPHRRYFAGTPTKRYHTPVAHRSAAPVARRPPSCHHHHGTTTASAGSAFSVRSSSPLPPTATRSSSTPSGSVSSPLDFRSASPATLAVASAFSIRSPSPTMIAAAQNSSSGSTPESASSSSSSSSSHYQQQQSSSSPLLVGRRGHFLRNNSGFTPITI